MRREIACGERTLLALTALVLAACQFSPGARGPTPSPTDQMAAVGPTMTPTPLALRPTSTERAWPTAIMDPVEATAEPQTPTPTPPGQASLGEEGPYLVVSTAQSGSGARSLLLFRADGEGQAQFALPGDYEINDLLHSLSPDGRYIVMHSGNPYDADALPGYRISLLDVRTGQLVFELPVVSEDILAGMQAHYGPVDEDEWWRSAQEALKNGIREFDWSPDGRKLAFAAQIDGPSSDLYLLDTVTWAVQRMSDGDDQIGYIRWSPDGRFILHASTWEVGAGMPHRFFSFDTQTGQIERLGETGWPVVEWLDATHVLLSDATNGMAGARAWVADMVTGDSTTVWSGGFETIDLDWEAQTAVVIGCQLPNIDDRSCGVFDVDLTTQRATWTEPIPPYDPMWPQPTESATEVRVDERGNQMLRDGRQTCFVSATGVELGCVSDRPLAQSQGGRFTLAPDGRHAFYTGYQTPLVHIDLATDRSVSMMAPGGVDGYFWADFALGLNPAADPAVARVSGVESCCHRQIRWVARDELIFMGLYDACQVFIVEARQGAVRAEAREGVGDAICPTRQGASSEPSPDPLAFGFTDAEKPELSVSPDGRSALVVTQTDVLTATRVVGSPTLDPDLPFFEQAWVVDLISGGKTLVAGSVASVSFQWGIDSRHLIVSGGNCYGGGAFPGLFTLDLELGTVATLDPGFMACEGQINWHASPTAELILTQAGRVIDYGGRIRVDLCPEFEPRAQTWSEDGRYAYVACRSGDGASYDVLRRYDVASGNVATLADPRRTLVRIVTLAPSPDGRFVAFAWGTNHYSNDEEFGWFVLDTLLVGD